MRRIRSGLAVVAAVPLLAGCGTSIPGLAAGGGTGGSSAAPGGTGALAGTAGTITGSFTLHVVRQSGSPENGEKIEDHLDVDFGIHLKRDGSGVGESYVDDGSTYEVSVLTTTERQLGNCVAKSETVANKTYKFADKPTTSFDNSISATVNRAAKTVTIQATYSWLYTVTGNACDGRQPFTGENSAFLACPMFGLDAKLVEGASTDQIDAGCELPGGEVYRGSLTLTK